MPFALSTLLGFTFLGGWLAWRWQLPLPGPVLGMLALTLALLLHRAWQGRQGIDHPPVPPALARLADGLIGVMGLMFVPAGVGVIAQLDLLRQQWLPIVAALLASTLLSLLATAALMQWLLRRQRVQAEERQ